MRVVYIGGFGNGRSSAEQVASALQEYYDDVDVFTFSEAISRPNTVARAVESVDTITHSAGMLALAGTVPERISAFGAPLPTAKALLVARTVLKTVRMHTPGIGIQRVQDITAIAGYDASAAGELVAHPGRNLGHLGQISRFDAVKAAVAARRSSSRIPTSLYYTKGDEYFQPSQAQLVAAEAGDVNVLSLPGIHDELIIRPAETLHAAFEHRNAAA